MMPPMVGETDMFGSFVLDRRCEAVTRNGEPIAIGHRGFGLLTTLLDANGETVSKADLMDAAWPDVIVEESNLTVQIAELRKALGQSPEGTDWIITVPRFGYRLVRSSAAADADSPDQRPALAVLPFANLSDDPEQGYFADGVVDDIITALSRFRSFAVTARNSSFAYKDMAVDVRGVARELGVRYVLEGSVRRAGGRVRVAAQLLDGTTGMHLWAETYDGVADDIFEMQDGIAASVVSIVEPQIQFAEIERSRRERPQSAAAYDLHLKAKSLFISMSPDDTAAALSLYLRLLDLEPGNAMFIWGAVQVVSYRLAMGFPWITANDRTLCIAWCHRGLALPGIDATAMAQLGMGLINAKEQELGFPTVLRAAELNPNSSTALCAAGIGCLLWGNLDEAEPYFRRILTLSRGGLDMHKALTCLAHLAMLRGDYEGALSWAGKSRLANENFAPTHWMLIAASAQLGRLDEARRWLARYLAISPGATIAGIAAAQPARDGSRLQPILEGLRMAGLPGD